MNNKYIQKYNKNLYTYEYLISQENINIINGKLLELLDIKNTELVKLSQEKAILNGAIKKDGYSYSIYNNRDKVVIMVNQKSLLHKKGRKGINNERRNAIIYLGSLLSNAIKVNEAYRKGVYSSVFYNILNLDGTEIIVRMIVTDNNFIQLESHKLYAISTKKGMNYSGNFRYPLEHTSSISVKELLNKVNSVKDANFSDVLSLDVLFKINGLNYKIKQTDIIGLKY